MVDSLLASGHTQVHYDLKSLADFEEEWMISKLLRLVCLEFLKEPWKKL